MPGGRLAKTVERWIDRAIARRATSLVTISGPMADYYAQFNPEVSVVLNGYDPEIMDDIRKTTEWRPRVDGKPLTIRYMGVITPGRVPHNLLSALAALVRSGQLQAAAFRFEIYGECDVLKDAVERGYPELAPSFGFFSRVRYRESLQLAVTADYLLFCETPSIASAQEQSSAQGVLTTKLFEYLASGRPVLADLSPETLAGETIRKAGDHHIVCASVEEFERLLGSPQFWAPCASVDHPFVRTLSRASQAQEYLRELDARVTAWQAPSGHAAARLESKATSSL
jgi:glycosyltransferase involved in cell wall biosynthesis